MHKNIIQRWTTLFGKDPLETFLLITFLNLIVWYLIPIQLLVFYGIELKLDISLFNKFSVIVFLSSTSVLIILYLFLYWIPNKLIFKQSPPKLQSHIKGVLIFLISLVTLAGYVFPFIKTTGGMVDEINIPTNWLNVIIVIALSGLITFFYYNKVAKKIIKIIFITFYLVTIPGGIINMVQLYSAKIDNSENLRIATQLSSKTNLLVISFDGVTGSVVNDIFNTNHEIQSKFKDFIHYSNVISTSPATRASMITELFGNIDMRNFSETEVGVIDKMPLENHIINKDIGKGVSASTYGEYNLFNIHRSTQLENIAPENVLSKNNEIFTLYGSEMSRLFTGKISGQIYPWITVKLLRPLFNFIAQNDPYQNHKGQTWDKKYLFNDGDYKALINNLYIDEGTDTLILKYFHFGHTHFPVDFDKSGHYRSDDEIWHKKNQNYLGLYNQTYYALRQFADLIRKLKELNIYDNTFLVFKSDHGNPLFYFDHYPDNLKINGHNLWGYSRYRPMLMIKDIGREEQSMASLPNLVSLGDLANTISTRFYQVSENSDSYPGINLLGDLDPSKSPNIYLNVVKDSLSNHHYDTHLIIKLDRSKSNSFVDLLKLHDTVRISNDSVQ